MTNVVIYARYSSHAQQETSIEGQLQVCEEYCIRNNYRVVGTYIDRALSATTDKRPQFLQMISDASKQRFTYVIVYQLDRFSRNRYDSATYKHKLKKHGVKVLSVKENISDDPNGILMESLFEGMAEYYSANLSQNVKRGMYINAKNGKSLGSMPLGYKSDADKNYIIDDYYATLVRFTFQQYAAGATLKEIAEQLNAEGFRTRQNNIFRPSILSPILKNRKYIGEYVFEDEVIPNVIPPIVSKELFAAVQKRFAENPNASTARKSIDEKYILHDKLYCGYCGAKMIGHSGKNHTLTKYRYYVCQNAIRTKSCNKKSIAKTAIEDIVIKYCKEQMTLPRINQIAEYVAKIAEQSDSTINLRRLEQQLNSIERKYNNTVTAVTECDISEVRQALYCELERLSKSKTQLEEEILIEKATAIRLDEKMIKFFLLKLKDNKLNSLDQKRQLINIFVDKIYLYDDKITIIFTLTGKPINITLSDLSEKSADIVDDKSLCAFLSGAPNRTYANYESSIIYLDCGFIVTFGLVK